MSRSPASPAARFIAGAIASAASFASSPALAKFKAAFAASFIPKVELAAASSMALLSRLASSVVLFIVLFAKVIVLSTSAKAVTAFVPAATIGSVTVVVSWVPTDAILSPTALILSPTSCIFSPMALRTWPPTVPKLCICFSRLLREVSSRSICVLRSLNSWEVLSTPLFSSS